jgi:hypothetical protein
MKTVALFGAKAAGRVALVDDEDYDLVSEYRWNVREWMRPGGGVEGPYAVTRRRVNGGQLSLSMHGIITGYARADHRNGNGLDNQRSNLRPATMAQNNHNQRPRSGQSSRYKGVVWHRRSGKWQATIGLNGRCVYLGVFASEEEAALAYNTAALETWGEYAWLNEVVA